MAARAAARSWKDLDQPLNLEDAQGLAKRPPADAVVVKHCGLVGELGALIDPSDVKHHLVGNGDGDFFGAAVGRAYRRRLVLNTLHEVQVPWFFRQRGNPQTGQPDPPSTIV